MASLKRLTIEDVEHALDAIALQDGEGRDESELQSFLLDLYDHMYCNRIGHVENCDREPCTVHGNESAYEKLWQ